MACGSHRNLHGSLLEDSHHLASHKVVSLTELSQPGIKPELSHRAALFKREPKTTLVSAVRLIMQNAAISAFQHPSVPD